MAPKNPPAEPPLPASAPVPLLLLPRTAAARPTFPRCAAPRRNAAVLASPGFLAATAARMPSARHNVKGDVLLQHVVTLVGCSLFLAQTRSRHRRPSVRHPATLAVFVSMVSTICQAPKLVYYRSHRQNHAPRLAVRRNAKPYGQPM
jgi:hypothetical protein